MTDTTPNLAALLGTPAGQAAQRLSFECSVRRCWLLHLAGAYRHWQCPGGGRVACVACGDAEPEGWMPTDCQRELNRLSVPEVPVPRNGEGNEGRGE